MSNMMDFSKLLLINEMVGIESVNIISTKINKKINNFKEKILKMQTFYIIIFYRTDQNY